MAKAKIRPLGEKVLIKRMEAESTTKGGIVLPDTAKEKPQRGKVVSVGPGKLLDSGKRSKVSLKKGDEVFYAKYSGTEVKIDGKDYVIIPESSILAIIEQ